jgi:hypothetical protein
MDFHLSDFGLIVLVILALYGVLINILTIPDIGRFFGFASDDTLPVDARLYAGSMAVRSTLRAMAKLLILAVGALVAVRMRLLIPTVGDTVIVLANLAVALLDIDSTITMTINRRMRARREGLAKDWAAFQEQRNAGRG